MADIFGTASGIVGAAGDIFGGFMAQSGDKAAAKAYKQAAGYAQQNAAVAARSGVIQGQQAARQIYQVIGGQESDIASAGFTGGGSNQYLRRSSLQQGGMTESLIANQAQINVQGYQAEAAADMGQASQAQSAGTAAAGGGILGAIGSILSIF